MYIYKNYIEMNNCIYVVKTWGDNKSYLGLFEFDGLTSWNTEDKAREQFKWAIYLSKFSFIELVKVDADSRDYIGTIIETEDNEIEIDAVCMTCDKQPTCGKGKYKLYCEDCWINQ
jgi:hypothetical protein